MTSALEHFSERRGPIAVGLGVRTIGASIITDAVLAAPYDNYRIYNGPQNPVLIIRGPYIIHFFCLGG